MSTRQGAEKGESRTLVSWPCVVRDLVHSTLTRWPTATCKAPWFAAVRKPTLVGSALFPLSTCELEASARRAANSAGSAAAATRTQHGRAAGAAAAHFGSARIHGTPARHGRRRAGTATRTPTCKHNPAMEARTQCVTPGTTAARAAQLRTAASTTAASTTAARTTAAPRRCSPTSVRSWLHPQVWRCSASADTLWHGKARAARAARAACRTCHTCPDCWATWICRHVYFHIFSICLFHCFFVSLLVDISVVCMFCVHRFPWEKIIYKHLYVPQKHEAHTC